MNRRDLVTTIAVGALIGGVWGAAFPAVASESRPSVAVVGEGKSQIVLIDSTDVRALLLVGSPNPSLMECLPAMMTLFRQRVDLVIGSRSMLEAEAMALRDRWSLSHAISLQTALEPVALAMPATVVTDSLAIDLGAGLNLTVRIGHRDEWRTGHPQRTEPLWSVELMHAGGTIAIAPDVPSLEATGTGASSMLLMPEAPRHSVLRIHPTSALAVNYDSELSEDTVTDGMALTRIYPEDIARFVLTEDELQLPPWTGMAPRI
jgi:hypothetical protein